MTFYLSISEKPDKKYTIRSGGKRIHFGGAGYSDYTKHKDPERKKRYLTRHRAKEQWGKTGIHTPGFWSRWLLWNQPSLQKSIEHTEKQFGIRIHRESS